MPRRSTIPPTPEKYVPDARGQAVLAAVIKEHLVTGEAVGPLVLANQFSSGHGWSSATIRNVMAELEEAGLVEQPHTSAGRVPTDKGYRYYVDNMLAEARLSRADLRAIDAVFAPGSVAAERFSGTTDGNSVARSFGAFAKRRHRGFAFAR